MLCAIWYHFDTLKNVKNTHGGVQEATTKDPDRTRGFVASVNDQIVRY